MRVQQLILVLILIAISGHVTGQSLKIPDYKNPGKGIEERVEDLLSRMTLEEKINMLSGGKNDDTDSNTDTNPEADSPSTIIRALNFQSRTRRNVRLGIPQFIMTDGPLGPNGKGGATNYSSSINLAATFDDSLIYKVAQSIGAETRNLGYNMLLAPCINIARAPHNGRTFESFGEDPYLISRMGVAFVKGVQSQRVATCTKHYIANNQEWNRMSVDVNMDERTLHEIYLPAFKAIVQEADGWTIMSAYNKTLGHYCAENKYLLQDVLKDDMGFTGVIVSDWGGVHSTVPTTSAGLDLEMPTGRFLGIELLLPEIKNGNVPVSLIDDKVSRILRVMFKAGLFDESVASYGGQTDTEYRRKLALEVAEKSIVLLKNENNFLPLIKENYKRVAVIGPNGNVARVAGGGSGGNNGHYAISPFEGIKNKYGECSDIQFQRGIAVSKMELPVVPSSMLELPEGKGNGVWAEYFNNRELDGEPALTQKEDQINFDWGYGEFRNPAQKGSPGPDIIQTDRWSARWTGKLLSPGNGWYDIGLKADNGVRLYLNSQLIIDAWTDQAPGKYKITQFYFEEGKKYDLKVEFYENWGSCRCIFGLEEFKQSPATDDAIELAKESDLVVMCMGLNADMEGEAKDRDHLTLPRAQIDLIKSIAKVNSNTIVVLYGATPIIMNSWIDDVPVIIDALYPGQEGGNALANIIFGDVSPSAKLPLTFLKKWEDSPVHGTYPGARDSAEYSEGIFMGYRHYDKYDIEPLFPFGFGLSFTTFEFSDLKLSQNFISEDDSLMVEVTLKNTGKMQGDEIVQLFISDQKASVEREVKSLKGFARVSLNPGESKTMSFVIDESHLSFYDVNTQKWIAEPGEFEILVGSSSRDIYLKDGFVIK